MKLTDIQKDYIKDFDGNPNKTGFQSLVTNLVIIAPIFLVAFDILTGGFANIVYYFLVTLYILGLASCLICIIMYCTPLDDKLLFKGVGYRNDAFWQSQVLFFELLTLGLLAYLGWTFLFILYLLAIVSYWLVVFVQRLAIDNRFDKLGFKDINGECK